MSNAADGHAIRSERALSDPAWGAGRMDEKLEGVYETVLRRNPGEHEFHQAVREVLETVGPIVAKHPEYVEAKLLERICEPERQIIFRVP